VDVIPFLDFRSYRIEVHQTFYSPNAEGIAAYQLVVSFLDIFNRSGDI